MARFRLGLIIGMGIGYVLGSKAGRQRYEQISSAWRTLSRSEPAKQMRTEVRDAANKAGHAIETKATEGVAKVTQMVRGDGNGATNPT